MKSATEQTLKFRQLKAALGLPLWQVKGLLQSLWDFAAQNAKAGDIGRYSNADIAFGIEYTDDPDVLIEALISTRWLDEHPRHRVIIHDWADHCEDSITRAIARAHGYFADGSPPRLTRFTSNERKELEEFYNKRAPKCAQMRPALADTDALADAYADTDTDTRCAPEVRTPTKINPSAFLSSKNGSNGSEAAAYALRMERASGERNEWWTWAAEVLCRFDEPFLRDLLATVEDAANPAKRRAKDIGELSDPGKFLFKRITTWAKGKNVKWPTFESTRDKHASTTP